MITMLKYYRLKNLEDELERLETKILKSKTLTRIDLQELEGLANEIQWLRYQISQK